MKRSVGLSKLMPILNLLTTKKGDTFGCKAGEMCCTVKITADNTYPNRTISCLFIFAFEI